MRRVLERWVLEAEGVGEKDVRGGGFLKRRVLEGERIVLEGMVLERKKLERMVLEKRVLEGRGFLKRGVLEGEGVGDKGVRGGC